MSSKRSRGQFFCGAAHGDDALRFRVGDRVRVSTVHDRFYHGTLTDVRSGICEVVDEDGQVHGPLNTAWLTPAPLRPAWAGERVLVKTEAGARIVGHIADASTFGAHIVEERTGCKYGPFFWSKFEKA